MKKVIITESQRGLMEKFFLGETEIEEASPQARNFAAATKAKYAKNPATATPTTNTNTNTTNTSNATTAPAPANNSADDRKKKLEGLSNGLKSQIKSQLSKVKIGSVITFTFGFTGKDDKIIKDSVKTYASVVTRKMENGVYVYLLTKTGDGKGIVNIPLDVDLLIPYSNSVSVGSTRSKLNVYMVTNMMSDKPKYKGLSLDHLLGFKVTDILNFKRENPDAPLNQKEIDGIVRQRGKIDKVVQSDTDTVIGEWDEKTIEIMKAAEITPALFYMNNFFFFPRGYAVMDDILHKYNMKSPRDTYNSGENVGEGQSKIKIIGNPVKGKNDTDLLRAKGEFVGTINKSEHYIGIPHKDGTVALQYQNDVTLGRNIEIPVKAFFLNKGAKKLSDGTPLNDTQIRIIKL